MLPTPEAEGDVIWGRVELVKREVTLSLRPDSWKTDVDPLGPPLLLFHTCPSLSSPLFTHTVTGRKGDIPSVPKSCFLKVVILRSGSIQEMVLVCPLLASCCVCCEQPSQESLVWTIFYPEDQLCWANVSLFPLRPT